MSTTKKRITLALVFLLTAALLAVGLTLSSFAEDTPFASYSIDGGEVQTAATEDDFVNAYKALTAGQTLKLESDVSLTKTLTTKVSVNVDLNGHTLTSTNGNAFTITAANVGLNIYSGAKGGNLSVKQLTYLKDIGGLSVTLGRESDGANRTNLTVTATGIMFCYDGDGKNATINLFSATFVEKGTIMARENKTNINATIKNAAIRFENGDDSAMFAATSVNSVRNVTATIENCDISSVAKAGFVFGTERPGDNYHGNSTITVKNSNLTNIAVNGCVNTGWCYQGSGYKWNNTVGKVVLGDGVTFNRDLSENINMCGKYTAQSTVIRTDSTADPGKQKQTHTATTFDLDTGCMIVLTNDGFLVTSDATKAVTVTWKDGDTPLRTDTWLKGSTPVYDKLLNDNLFKEESGDVIRVYGFSPTVVQEDVTFSVDRETLLETVPVAFRVTNGSEVKGYAASDFVKLGELIADGATVTVLKDIGIPFALLEIGTSVTVDLGGHTLTVAETVTTTPVITVKQAASVVLKNGTIYVSDGAPAGNILLQKTGTGSLTVQNATIRTATTTRYAIQVMGNSGDVLIEDCLFDANIKTANYATLFLSGEANYTVRNTMLKDRLDTTNGKGVANDPAAIIISGAWKATVTLDTVKVIADQVVLRVTGSTEASHPTLTVTDSFLYTEGTGDWYAARLIRTSRVDATFERSVISVRRAFQLEADNSVFRFNDCYFVKSGQHFSEGAKTTTVYLENTVLGANFSERSKNMSFYIGKDVIFTKAVNLSYITCYDNTDPKNPVKMETAPTVTNFNPVAGLKSGETFKHYAAASTAFSDMKAGDTLYIYDLDRVQPVWTLTSSEDSVGADIEADRAGTLLYFHDTTEFVLRTLLGKGVNNLKIKLFRDYDITATTSISQTIYLDLNGHTLNLYRDDYASVGKYNLFKLSSGANVYFFSSVDGALVEVPYRFKNGVGFLFEVAGGATLNLGYMSDGVRGKDITFKGAAMFQGAGDGAKINAIGGVYTRKLTSGAEASDNTNSFYQANSPSIYHIIGGVYYGTVFAVRDSNGKASVVTLDGCKIEDSPEIFWMHQSSSGNGDITLKNIRGGKLTLGLNSSNPGHYFEIKLDEGCVFNSVNKDVYTSANVSLVSGVEFAASDKDNYVYTMSGLPKLYANLTLTDMIRFNLYAGVGSGIVSINGQALEAFNDVYNVYRFEESKMYPHTAHNDIVYTAEIDIDGTVYTVKRTTSVLAYMKRVLDDENQSAEGKALIRALGAYMEEAVRYAGLFDEATEAKFRAALGAYTAPVAVEGIEKGEAAPTAIKSISIILGDAPQFALYLEKGNTDTVILRYTDAFGNVRNVQGVETEDATYRKLVFTVPAYDFGSSTFEFVVGDATYAYTLKNYIHSAKAEALNLCYALDAYTNAAKAYVAP